MPVEKYLSITDPSHRVGTSAHPTILLLILGYPVNMTTKRVTRRAIPWRPY